MNGQNQLDWSLANYSNCGYEAGSLHDAPCCFLKRGCVATTFETMFKQVIEISFQAQASRTNSRWRKMICCTSRNKHNFTFVLLRWDHLTHKRSKSRFTSEPPPQINTQTYSIIYLKFDEILILSFDCRQRRKPEITVSNKFNVAFTLARKPECFWATQRRTHWNPPETLGTETF